MSNRSIASSWRPNALTMLCPVCISSTWPLSVPVRAHCCANCCCDRFATNDRDHDRQRHRQQRDDRQQRADPEHHRQDADDRAQGGDQLGQGLLERVGDVVDVVGDTAQRVAARMAVVVAQRQTGELQVDVPAHPVDGPLRDAGHDVRLPPGEDGARDVDRGDEQQHVAERLEVHAVRHGQAREQVRLLRLAGGPQRIDRLLLREAFRDLLADDAIEDDVGRRAEDLRAGDGTGHAQDRQAGRPGRSAEPRAEGCRRAAGTSP